LSELLTQTKGISKIMSERLDRIETDLEKTQAIANSNARAIEAMLQQMAMDREERSAVLEVIAKQQK